MPTLHQCEISVIVPVYNLEKYIQPLLNTLKAQDLGEYKAEYIFVLNNCTDNSRQVIENSGLECQIIECELQGCGCARNAGFEKSTGEYIWFIDGDDWLLSKEAIKHALDKAKAENLQMMRIPFYSQKYTWFYFSMVWQYLFKRTLIEDMRFRQKQPGEDDEFTAEALSRIGYNRHTYWSMPFINETLYYYNYMREGSNMHRYYMGETI